MRELKDYFCTFTQKQKLIELGFDGDAHIISAEYYYKIDTPFEGILRSQALDFFRDKGESYKWLIDRDYQKYIKPDNKYETVEEAESALIDKLIELETEAQHGN